MWRTLQRAVFAIMRTHGMASDGGPFTIPVEIAENSARARRATLRLVLLTGQTQGPPKEYIGGSQICRYRHH